MNDMEKENKGEFFNRLKSTSAKIRAEEFKKKDVYDQIQELEYLLGYNKDRIIELSFERERLESKIKVLRNPPLDDRYGIFTKLAKDKNKEKKRKKRDKLDKLFTEFWEFNRDRFDPIKLSSRLKEIAREIDERSIRVQTLKGEIEIRKNLMLDKKEYRHYRNKKPNYTPSILYDKEYPEFRDVKRKTRKTSKKKNKKSVVTLKICILGKKDVGISTWVRNFTDLHELERWMLGGCGFGVKSIRLEDKTFKLQIWFLNIHRIFKKRYYSYPPLAFETYIRGCNGAFLMYDITNYESLSRMSEWIHSIREICGDIPIFLLGNKCDLENLREVSKEQGIDLVKKYDLSGIYEISVKTGKNADLLFQKISELYSHKFLEINHF